MKPRLHAVPTVSEPVDITLDRLRPEIEKRDWSACHVAGDKGPRINLPEKRHMRLWRR